MTTIEPTVRSRQDGIDISRGAGAGSVIFIDPKIAEPRIARNDRGGNCSRKPDRFVGLAS